MMMTALLMGLAGSLHCIGMCSPLAMAASRFSRNAFLNRVIYNGGRTATYSLLGLIFGLTGGMVPIQGFQNVLSVTLGICFLLLALIGVNSFRIPVLSNALSKLSVALKIVFARFLSRKNYFAVWILGMLNGLLPCGLTLIALAYSITLGGAFDSFYFMLLFGLGTWPAMLGLTTGLSALIAKYNVDLKKITMTMFFVTGCLLIGRAYFHQAHKQQSGEIVTCGAPSLH